MNNVDLTDQPPATEAADPSLRRVVDILDREFSRRDSNRLGPYEYVARQLGVDVAQLVVIADDVEPTTGDSIGAWLFETQQRYAAPHAGASAGDPATSEKIEGAQGDVHAFGSAIVIVPPKVLHTASVALRIRTGRYEVGVELIARREDAEGLDRAFARFLHDRQTAGSPYKGGAYRVSTSNSGLTLARWPAPRVSRDLLKLDPAIWETIDRSVHRVLEFADDLTARGLGTSSGVLLVGPPGTGKTQLGTVVAAELSGKATVLVPGTYVVEHFMTELFDLAGALSPCLLQLDDLDLVAGERGHTNPHRLREFLNVMDGGLADRSGVVVIASTNDHKKIDKAAQRASRFDTVIKMEAPGREGRISILQRYLAWFPNDLDLAAVAEATDGATGADLKDLVRQTVLETRDDVTTEALLRAARSGRWSRTQESAGVYL